MPIIRGSIYRIIPFVVLIFATLSAPARVATRALCAAPSRTRAAP